MADIDGKLISKIDPNLLGNALRCFSITAILSVTFVALAYMVLAISVNSGRISHLQRGDAKIQAATSQISRDPRSSEVSTLQTQLLDFNRQKDSDLGEIEYGAQEFWSLSFLQCAIPTTAQCFHKNASETNNLYLALAGGVIGGCLYLLLGMYVFVSTVRVEKPDRDPFSLLAVTTYLPMSMMVGLATLFAVRGTKGALLSPVANIVQLENPYGIAFVTTVAAFASVRILTLATGLVDTIPNLWKKSP